MIYLIKSLLSILNKEQRKKLYLLQILVLISAVIEILSIAMIAPFMAIVGNPETLRVNETAKAIYSYSGAVSIDGFLVIFGGAVLIALLVSACLSIFTIRSLSNFAAAVGAEFGNRLYKYYMTKSYIFHASGNSAELVKKIAAETSRITDNILQPFVQINSRVGTVLFVAIFIFIYNAYIATALCTLLTGVYFILYKIVKQRLAINGKKISEYSEKRLQMMAEGFSSIKELHLLQKTDFYTANFSASGEAFSQAYGSSNSIYNTPRYIVEFIVYGVLIGLVITSLNIYDGDATKMLSMLSVFGVATIKMLPSFQQIYSGTAQIKGNISALKSAKHDLISAKEMQISAGQLYATEKLSGNIVAKNLFFSFSQPPNILSDLSITIPEKQIIGIIGASGAGKSTLLDILIGAIAPDHGTILVGNADISLNMQKWRRSIGYVSQMAALRDATVAENIAFGCHLENINIRKLEEAITKSKLFDWVSKLPQGYLTRVGERGLQISGGQRQRIAIARALYYDADYLFFDEATSALDPITEKEILDSILSAAANKTVVMVAHKINTLKSCDFIYVISEGKVEDCGTYADLLRRKNRLVLMSEKTD